MTVRTRFAPSPTGYLHIGGVRTALFNWLYSRQNGGEFILRIDDTDQQRNVQEALQPILDGFRWLGIDWDEGPEVGGPCGPYFQSQRGDRYRHAVGRLLEMGTAYRDYARSEEIQAEREAAEREKRPFRYSRRWMAQDDRQAAEFEAEGRSAVIRLKMPAEGSCRFVDLIRGEVEFEWAAEQDHVIQRADGTFLYHLASVVDDHDFGITHVIRAVEHLSNTPRQWFIASALGWDPPRFAHLPYVAEPGSSNKLSKRKLAQYLKNADFRKLFEHGQQIARKIGLAVSADTFNPVIVDFYREIGYLPDALVNYLLLLGWSLDDRTEQFTREEMVRQFSLERVNRAPASFDPQKLGAFQDRYMRLLPAGQKVPLVLPYLQRAGLIEHPPTTGMSQQLVQILEAAGDRIKVAGDILDFSDFFTPDDRLAYDEAAWQKRLVKPAQARDLLTRFRHRLTESGDFTADSVERLMQGFVRDEAIGIGQIIHAVRVAVTGKSVGFGMFETLAILGRKRCVNRIDIALDRLSSSFP
jgi:glutamyl-tRNA synthetase